MVAFVAAQVINEGGNIQSSAGSGSGSGSGTSVSTIYEPGSPTSEMQGGGIVVPAPTVTAKPPALSQPAMSTNVGMVGWLLAIIQDYPIILVGVAGSNRCGCVLRLVEEKVVEPEVVISGSIFFGEKLLH